MITKERLDELLSYDPETGVFTWKVASSRRVKPGDTTGCPDSGGYLLIRVDGRLRSAHRLAFIAMTGSPLSTNVDHINGDRADNRWCNLRMATSSQNSHNRRVGRYNTSGVPGVTWNKRLQKWRAFIRSGGEATHLGLFVEFEDAVAARRAAEVKYFGEFSATASRS